MILYAAVFICLSYFGLILPLQKQAQRIKIEDFRQRYYLFQLQQVKKNYPAVQDLSYNEIRKKYNVTESYKNLHK